MYSTHHFEQEDKENKHPNNSQPIESNRCVQEADFSKIGRRYVLDGQKLRVKSIIYKDDKKQTLKAADRKPYINNQIDEMQIVKLEYLEKMGVINQEERQILNRIRRQKDDQGQNQLPSCKAINPYASYPYKLSDRSQLPQYNAPFINNNSQNNRIAQEIGSKKNRLHLSIQPSFNNQDYMRSANSHIQMNAAIQPVYENTECYHIQPQCEDSQQESGASFSAQCQNYYY